MPPTPALSSLSLYAGDTRIREIEDVIRTYVTSQGLALEQVFDRLGAYSPADSTYVVAHMIEQGKAVYLPKKDLFKLT